MEEQHKFLKYVSAMPSTNLQELMREYGRDVWSYAFLLTKNHHLSDDIAQDVFLQAFLHVASFRGQSAVRTWLFAITRNIALNYKKSAFFRKVTLQEDIHPAPTSSSAEEQSMDKIYTDDIWRLVMRLAPKYREVLVLDAKYDLALSEIASLMHISTGTVKSRLHRARNKMQQMLKEVQRREGE